MTLHIKVMTPCFASQLTSAYTTSLLKLVLACQKRGIQLSWWFHTDALITRARAECVALFLNETEPTHLLFVNGGIGFEPDQVFRLLDFDADVTAAAYPANVIDRGPVSFTLEKYRQSPCRRPCRSLSRPTTLAPGPSPLGCPGSEVDPWQQKAAAPTRA